MTYIDSSASWQLWHTDIFDRDTPPSLQASGANIVSGLYELWFHTLKEGILDNGSASFSRFHLTCGNTLDMRVDLVVNPFNNLTLLKLRQWSGLTSQDQERQDTQAARHLEEQREVIVSKLAQRHYELLHNRCRLEASGMDWSAEAKELLARIDLISDPNEL